MQPFASMQPPSPAKPKSKQPAFGSSTPLKPRASWKPSKPSSFSSKSWPEVLAHFDREAERYRRINLVRSQDLPRYILPLRVHLYFYFYPQKRDTARIRFTTAMSPGKRFGVKDPVPPRPAVKASTRPVLHSLLSTGFLPVGGAGATAPRTPASSRPVESE
jgi:hypothetical protein